MFPFASAGRNAMKHDKVSFHRNKNKWKSRLFLSKPVRNKTLLPSRNPGEHSDQALTYFPTEYYMDNF